MEILQQRVGVDLAEDGFDGVHGEVHVGQPPRVGIGLLPVDQNLFHVSPLGIDEVFELDEHAPEPQQG